MRVSTSIFGAGFFSGTSAHYTSPYENPYTLEPPLHTDASGPACSLQVFESAISSYNDRPHYRYHPSSCPGTYDKIVLRLRGAVAGLQFDRMGAVWLSGVELLRLTTPEPSDEGISWAVDKDVSEYADVFNRVGNAVIEIPNIVNSEYTGVLYVNVSFDFYGKQTPAARARSPRRHVVPLVDFSVGNYLTPGHMCILGNKSTTASITLPTKNIRNMWVDMMASGHHSEEAWYMHHEDPYRELRIFIDGTLAGIAYPLPMVYTGTFQPLLWRPLTGIETFNIEPYRFNVSPFLPILNDGKPHDITVNVFGNSDAGWWCLDPILIMEEDPHVNVFSPVHSPHVNEPKINVHTTMKKTVSESDPTGSHDFSAIGLMRGDNGEVVKHTVVVKLNAVNSVVADPPTEHVTGVMKQNVYVASGPANGLPSQSMQLYSNYPYSVYQTSGQNSQTHHDNVRVIFGRNESLELTAVGEAPFTTQWHNQIAATVAHTRSLSNHGDVDVKKSSSNELFTIWSSISGLCYDRHVTAANGYTITDSGLRDTCAWPPGVSFCGEKVCGISSFAGGAGVAALDAQATPVHPQVTPMSGAMVGGEEQEKMFVPQPAGGGMGGTHEETTVGQPRAVFV